MPDAVTIREALSGDLKACADIVNDWIDATDWMPRLPSREVIEQAFNPSLLDERLLLVALEDGSVIGYLSMEEA